VVFLAVFFVSFLESLAIVGLAVPGVALLFFLALTAAEHSLSPAWLLASAFTGAYIGDIISYWLGYSLKTPILRSQFAKKNTKLFQQSRQLCQKYGIFAVFIGRFIGPLRPIVPIVVGILHYPAKSLYTVSGLACLLWAPTYLGPGYFLSQWDGFRWHYLWIVIVCLLLGKLIYSGWRRWYE